MVRSFAYFFSLSKQKIGKTILTYKFFQFLAYFKFISGSNDDILPLKSLSQLLFLFTNQFNWKPKCRVAWKLLLKSFQKRTKIWRENFRLIFWSLIPLSVQTLKILIGTDSTRRVRSFKHIEKILMPSILNQIMNKRIQNHFRASLT